MKKLLGYLLVALLSTPLVAQNRTKFAGIANASDYAFGVNPNVPAIINDSAPTAVGSATLTLRVGQIAAADGTLFSPFQSGTPLIFFTIGAGSSVQETVQASAVSCTTPQIQDSCTVTATFANSHAQGERIVSADFGVQEAANYLYTTLGGGQVALDPYWVKLGGTNAVIAADTTGFSTIPIQDNRGTAVNFWSAQPSTVSLISAPTTLTAANISQPAACSTSNGTCPATWTASEPFFCVAYVDILGQLSACSGSFQPSSNLTASLPVTITAPAASAGAVGWVAFAGTSALASFQLPITNSAGVANGACPLTTLETAIPACALTNSTYGQVGSAATFNILYSNTNMQAPLATNTTANISNPVYQAHTAFSYQPTASLPTPFQSNFSLWPANTASQSSTNIAVLGTVNLPVAYLNTITRTVRVTGKVIATVTSAGTPTVIVAAGWIGGYSTGAPTALCTIAGGATTTGTAVIMPFSCTLTTNAVGTTAVGTLFADGFGFGGAAGAVIPATDAGTAVVGSLGLFSSAQLFVEFEDNGQASTAAKLADLHVETLQ